MSRDDSSTTIQDLKDLVAAFSTERHWQKHHTPKNLAMGIAIEAAELMEHYQWERGGAPDAEAVADELADVLFNLLNFARIEHIDITSSFLRKYQKLLKKYPVELFNEQRDDLDEYKRIKNAYRRREEH